MTRDSLGVLVDRSMVVMGAQVDINNKLDEYAVNIRENTQRGDVWTHRLRDLVASRKAAAAAEGYAPLSCCPPTCW